MPSFGKYTRDRESDEYSTPGEINKETGTPTAHDEVADDTEEEIVDTFTSTPNKE